MDLQNGRPGYAFEGDYPEEYPEGLERLQDILTGQLTELDKVNDAVRDAAIVGVLRGRRCSQRDLLQIAPPKPASAVLVASRERLVTVDEWSDRDVQSTLREDGFDDLGERLGAFVLLRESLAKRPEIQNPGPRATVEDRPNSVATLAAVGKGVGGPEPVKNPLPETKQKFEENFRDAAASTGTAPIVAVIDTGIPGRYDDGLPTMQRTDGWLDNVSRSDGNRDLLDYLPQRDGFLDFQAGHGVFVAGIVQRVAPAATIRVYRAADTDGFADDAGIADALWKAVEDGARIVNLSLGMVTTNSQAPPVLKHTIEKIKTEYSDTVIVAAAGNFGPNSDRCWPAAFDDVKAVGALMEPETVDEADTREGTGEFVLAPWSSDGDDVNLWTVAEGVRSTFVTGYESPIFDPRPDTFPQDAWAMWNGTSFAAPQIAGAIARICYELNKTPAQAVGLLEARGADVQGQQGKAMRILPGIARRQAPTKEAQPTDAAR
jgi:hypothetical protein